MGEYTNYIGRRIKMNLNKNLLLVTAIIGIGLFVLPSTLSMFAGQHSWYNPDPDIEGIPCEKCHTLEAAELGSGPHSTGYDNVLNDSANYSGTGSGPGNATFWGVDNTDHRCLGCHQVGANFTEDSEWYDYNTNWTTRRNQTHAAVVIQCIDCHPWVPHELTYEDSSISAAHKPFYVSLNETTTVTNGTALLKGANEACLACHTHVGVNITWTRAAYTTFNVSINDSDPTNLFYDVKWNDSDTLGTNTTPQQTKPGYP